VDIHFNITLFFEGDFNISKHWTSSSPWQFVGRNGRPGRSAQLVIPLASPPSRRLQSRIPNVSEKKRNTSRRGTRAPIPPYPGPRSASPFPNASSLPRDIQATAAASPGGVYPFQRRSIPAAARPEASPPGARRSPAEAPSGARPRTAEWTVLWSSVWFQV
jgi:hypothetical protein